MIRKLLPVLGLALLAACSNPTAPGHVSAAAVEQQQQQDDQQDQLPQKSSKVATRPLDQGDQGPK